jgi:6-pyruvoyl-tetrahydropterin synthase related domain
LTYSNANRKLLPTLQALLALGTAAFAVEIPFFFYGTPSGHDVEFHLYSWLEVLAQWKHGILYPRWASMANFGYGEPRFVFYPPASWTLGSVIAAIFPWKLASPVFIWIALVAAGWSMFVLVRRWLSPRDAIFAAVFYAVNPYHLLIVYWRSAFAELLASCLIPLLVLTVLRAADEGWRALTPLSLVLAAAWLTNAPAAVMIHYSLALLILLFAWQHRDGRILFVGAAAVALAACLSAFYLLPAIYEQRWVDIAQAISAGSRPQDSFLFIHTTDRDHDAFNHIVSWVAVLEIVTTLGAAWVARGWFAGARFVESLSDSRARTSPSGPLQSPDSLTPTLWIVLVGWALACSVLMFSMTSLVWRFLPKLEFMQFPWRWLLCLSMLFVLFATLGLRRGWMRFALYAVAVLIVVGGWHRIQSPWWDQPPDLKEMQDNMHDRIGYEGVDEYTPLGADPSLLDQNAPNVVVEGAEQSKNATPGAIASQSPIHIQSSIHIQTWTAESKSFTADMPVAGELALRLFSYPAWKIEVNGRVVDVKEKSGSGQLLVPVSAGTNHVRVTFTRTWDRRLGGCLSAAAALFMVLLAARRKMHRFS